MDINATQANLSVDDKALQAFCEQWQIAELSLFGSVLRADFTDQSDVDVLIKPMMDRRYRLEDLMQMEQDLAAIFGRKVDLGLKHTVENDPNYLRRDSILRSARVIYAK